MLGVERVVLVLRVCGVSLRRRPIRVLGMGQPGIQNEADQRWRWTSVGCVICGQVIYGQVIYGQGHCAYSAYFGGQWLRSLVCSQRLLR